MFSSGVDLVRLGFTVPSKIVKNGLNGLCIVLFFPKKLVFQGCKLNALEI